MLNPTLVLRTARLSTTFLTIALAACEGASDDGDSPAAFAEAPMELPDTASSFLDTPWPSDWLRFDDGTLNFLLFPNPYGAQILEDYLVQFADAPGFAQSTTVYARLPELDVATLPAGPVESIERGASVFLIELEGDRRRIPVVTQYYREATDFLPAGSLAVQPLLGFFATTKAALVVTREATNSDGVSFGPSDDMQDLLSCDSGDVRGFDCGDVQLALDAAELTADDVALIVPYTPQDAHALVRNVAAVAQAYQPQLLTIGLSDVEDSPDYQTYLGTVGIAQFQAGTAPFDAPDGNSGGFEFAADGTPTVVTTENVPFALSVPNTPMPPNGYPVAIVGHGTAGSYLDMLGDTDFYEAQLLVQAGYAAISISEPLHEGRRGYRDGSEERLTFNFLNPLAGRANWIQSAVEKQQLVTLLQAFPEDAIPGVRFDAQHVSYFGHSQGGIVGALMLGTETRLKGAFLSGAGAGFAASIVAKTDPVDIVGILKLALGIPEAQVVDDFHPVLTLLQTWVDAADPLYAGPAWRASPKPPAILALSGLVDTYTPPATHAALAAAFGLPLVKPEHQALVGLQILDIPAVDAPVVDNIPYASGKTTGGMLQYPDGGHFVIYRDDDAVQTLDIFFESMLDGPAQIDR